ncbi:MAG: helix-turn-helix transcriptional regulator, partial [Coxiellaceae bacterium]|nr:helix-turn-helix transcriptional regulator [Coxiellaceae bacterium]
KITTELKQIRADSGLSQSALGERVGLPQNHISKIESGKTDPRLSSLIEIARSLGYELMLVPRNKLELIELTLQGKESSQRARWQLDDSEDSDEI